MERVTVSSTLVFPAVESAEEYRVCYYFKLLDATFATEHVMTIYPAKFPASVTPENPVVMGEETAAEVTIELRPEVVVTKDNRVFVSQTHCVYADEETEAMTGEMTLRKSVQPVVGEQSICVMYGNLPEYAVELATFTVSKYSGLSALKFAANLPSEVAVNVVNANTGRHRAPGVAHGGVRVCPVEANATTTVLIEVPVSGVFDVLYKFLVSDAWIRTGEQATVAQVQSVYPTVLVTGESRAFEIEGFALENADRILVSSEGCEETATKGVPADTVLSFPAAGAFELCYYYANVGSMVIAEFAVRDVEYQGRRHS